MDELLLFDCFLPVASSEWSGLYSVFMIFLVLKSCELAWNYFFLKGGTESFRMDEVLSFNFCLHAVSEIVGRK